MAELRRLESHRGRVSKETGKVYSKRHHDLEARQKANHVKKENIEKNVSWYALGTSQIECELKVYDKYYKDWLDAQNQKYKQKGNYDRIRTMEDIIKNKRLAPEQTILQIGDKDNPISAQDTWTIAIEYIRWHNKEFPNAQIISAHLDLDETTPHVHLTQVYLGVDPKTGLCKPAEASALKEMGIERPNPEEKEWKMNNPKITYTKICRDKQIEIIESMGYEINKVPREASESGLKFTEYKARQEQKKLEQAKQDYEEVLTKKIACEEEKSAIEQSIGNRQTALMGVEEDISAKMDELTTIKAQIQDLTKDFDKKSAELEESLKSAKMELTRTNQQIEKAQPELEKITKAEETINKMGREIRLRKRILDTTQQPKQTMTAVNVVVYAVYKFIEHFKDTPFGDYFMTWFNEYGVGEEELEEAYKFATIAPEKAQATTEKTLEVLNEIPEDELAFELKRGISRD